MRENRLILISHREEDHLFFGDVAKRLSLELAPAANRSVLQNLLLTSGKAVVVWELDHPDAGKPGHPYYIQGIRSVLSKMIKAACVFGVTDQPLGQYPEVFKSPPYFHNHLYRRSVGPVAETYAKLIALALEKPVSIVDGLGPWEVVKKYKVKASGDRGIFAEDVECVLEGIGLKSRLAKIAAQASDELLMNAVFNAPVNSQGYPVRRQMDRGKHFELPENEVITMDIFKNGKTIGICVTDHFGSLKSDVLLKILAKDFKSQKFKVNEANAGAGLGIHGMIGVGLSMIFACKAGVRTDAMIMFQGEESHKAFKQGFQFVSYLGESPREVIVDVSDSDWTQFLRYLK